MIEISSSKQSSFKKVDEPSLNLGALHDPLVSINPSRFGEFGWFRDFVSELSIRLSRVSLYLLRIATISDFPSASLTAYLSTCFQRIMTIWFWRGRGVLAQIFLRQV